MTADGFTFFDTAIGSCGIAWGASGIVGTQLPEDSDERTRARMASRFPGATESVPPQGIQDAIEAVIALLGGASLDLLDIPLDMTGVAEFDVRVYDETRAIPPGKTLSYGDVSARLGLPGAAQAVGQALGRNPFAIIVPCHRVLAADGKMHGFSAGGGITTKRRMLVIEGAIDDEPTLF
ncbi:methylated-DNA--[protein]-cysteine S-methyltransferase [Amycolatopsis sp.]|jgi:methylated-DNA-[protein]-cysteine S-methyltransferase|uniref:methylated-DNA--[protein]-cysteine S-methyltransferase n=1 Tax=Amycolatopsis sp. TaxID=37632 RepID=UPI002E085B0C|nr:methylated-DNA--[protein]-cysteine S-methyltransferase [Amycolatopsis sp.]